MCFGFRTGRPKTCAAASAPPPPRKGLWGRACFVPPSRALAGASLGPGAGWHTAPAGPYVLRQKFGLASGPGSALCLRGLALGGDGAR